MKSFLNKKRKKNGTNVCSKTTRTSNNTSKQTMLSSIAQQKQILRNEHKTIKKTMCVCVCALSICICISVREGINNSYYLLIRGCMQKREWEREKKHKRK